MIDYWALCKHNAQLTHDELKEVIAVTQIFGDFIENPGSQEYLIIGFSPTSLPLQQRWRNSGLSADFLADYVSTFFPSDDSTSLNRQAEVKDAVSFVANELLENAMKFSYAPSDYPVNIGLHLEPDCLKFYVTNTVDPQTVEGFQQSIQEILTGDLEEMYIHQLESNADDESDDETSHMGFLTMIHDYDAQLAWKFETLQTEPEIITVTIMVRLAT